MHNCIVFKPILIKKLTAIEQKCSMERLVFLTEKKNEKRLEPAPMVALKINTPTAMKQLAYSND
jgi:hypothetical protein